MASLAPKIQWQNVELFTKFAARNKFIDTHTCRQLSINVKEFGKDFRENFTYLKTGLTVSKRKQI